MAQEVGPAAKRRRVLPEGQRNMELERLEEDHLFHIEDDGFNTRADLPAKLGDVKYVLMGGPQARAEAMADELSRGFGWPIEPLGSRERYALYKVGPCMAISHGIGMPSMTIVLHELTKALHYAGCTDVCYIRIGTSGGIGVTPGTIVVASEGVNGLLESKYETIVLGKRKAFDARFDAGLAEELAAAAKRISVPAVVGKTMGTNDYYEEQGRLDGAVATGYTEEEKMAWLRKCYEAGVRNFEMEGPGLGAFCKRTGIRGALVAAALLDRLHGDQTPQQASIAQIQEWNHNAMRVAIEWVRAQLVDTPGKTLSQVTNCSQFVDAVEVPVIDMAPWYDGSCEGRQRVVEELRTACEKVGRFFIRNHGIKPALIADMLDASKRFFDQPYEAKAQILMREDDTDGYEAKEVLAGTERAANGAAKGPDLKETFSICLGPEGNAHPAMPQCSWPEGPGDLQSTFTAYYRACEKVVNELLKIAALALELPEGFFADKVDRHIATLRGTNYPDTRLSPLKPGQLRASPCTDVGTFTLLAAGANSDGLQVLKKDGSWLDVTLPEDCLSVNVGDMLCRWTNDRWRSTRHRVAAAEGDSENQWQSVAFVHRPNPDALVQTLPSCVSPSNPDKYKDVKAGDYPTTARVW